MKRLNQTVILLHGLARTKSSMEPVSRYLKSHGYTVVNLDYPSTRYPIEHLSQTYIKMALDQCHQERMEKIHFVTHSLGGILVRYYLNNNPLPNIGRIVMLSPPNQGSEVVDKLKHLYIFKWLNGPAGQQLGTDAYSIPNILPRLDLEIGIITGDRTINPILSWIIPGEDDGKVAVKRARLKGMKDFLVVHRSHPLIMNDLKVHQQIHHFIINGKFNHTE